MSVDLALFLAGSAMRTAVAERVNVLGEPEPECDVFCCDGRLWAHVQFACGRGVLITLDVWPFGLRQ